jgi:hypothetical protein
LVRPITEKFLEPNYLAALEWGEGWIFTRIIRRRIVQAKPYRLVDSAGNDVDIPPSSAQPELRFRDRRNPENDILYLDTTTDSGWPWILHGSIGIRPSQVSMYLRMPEGQIIPGRFPEIDPIRPSSGDEFGYIDYSKSPYEEPTDFVEIIIPPGQHLGAEYYNHDTVRSHQPVMNLLFALYHFQVLKPDKHPKLISAIATRAVPAAFLTVGFGDKPLDMGSTLQKDWDIKPISLDEAAALGGR